MIRLLLIIGFFAFMNISPLSPRFWTVGEQIGPASIGSAQMWQNIPPEPPTDMDFGSDQDCLVYQDQAVRIMDCQRPEDPPKWQSPQDWKVTEALSADLNRDGSRELVMLVWRPFKPWPIDSFLPHGGRIEDFHDRSGMSCHVILVGWDGEKYRELWAGSALIDPVFGLRAADLDQDGHQELAALEGRYDSSNRFGNLTVWDWSGFGFKLRARLEGKFSEFGIVSVDNTVLIISD